MFCGKKPCRKSLTAGSPSCGSNVNCKRHRKAVVTWYFAVCGLPFPMKNLMLKVPIIPTYLSPLNSWFVVYSVPYKRGWSGQLFKGGNHFQYFRLGGGDYLRDGYYSRKYSIHRFMVWFLWRKESRKISQLDCDNTNSVNKTKD